MVAWRLAGPVPRRPLDAVRDFATGHGERIAFHALAAMAGGHATGRCRGAGAAPGMSIGLYRDLAVGADPGGSEIWSAPERFAAGVVGRRAARSARPPGAELGPPALRPARARTQGLRRLPGARCARTCATPARSASTTPSSSQRLFLIPRGAPAADGAYVRYPFEAMLAPAAARKPPRHAASSSPRISAPRRRASRTPCMAAGLLSYRVLLFERERQTARSSRRTPIRAPRLPSITTHDLPTFARLVARARHRHCASRSASRRGDRARARTRGARQRPRRLAEALAGERLLPTLPSRPTPPPLRGRGRATSPAPPRALTGLQIEDVAGELNQANMPGSIEGHPELAAQARPRPGDHRRAGRRPRQARRARCRREGREPRARRAARSPRRRRAPPTGCSSTRLHLRPTRRRSCPYLARLGISHVYASPIAEGAARLHPRLRHRRPRRRSTRNSGGEDGLPPPLGRPAGARPRARCSTSCRTTWASAAPTTRWWLSVLEWGALSPFANAFDIDWERLGREPQARHPVPRRPLRRGAGEGRAETCLRPRGRRVQRLALRAPLSDLPADLSRSILDRALAASGDARRDATPSVLAIAERLRGHGRPRAAPERRAPSPRRRRR